MPPTTTYPAIAEKRFYVYYFYSFLTRLTLKHIEYYIMLSTKFTLRSHKSSVAYIYQDPRTPFNLFTADSSGLIINWDLTIRRPKKSWQAHTDTILTISTIHNHLLTHSRDNTIKIWDESYSCILEIPCNALNFSNICIIYDLLITPASINSNNLDVYKIDKDWQITRLISDFDVYKLVNKGEIIEEIGSSGTSRNDFGIIMQMKIITTNTTTGENDSDYIIYVGFESGDIVGLQLVLPRARMLSTTGNTNDKTLINQSAKFILQYHNSTHVPNPVICLLSLDSVLVSGSTTNKVIIHSDPIEIMKMDHSGIQAIVNFKNDRLIFGYWNGYIQYGDISINQSLPKLGNTEQEKSKLTKKLTFMTILNESNQETLQSPTGKSKYLALLKSKRNLVFPLLLAGYEDGSILAYNI